jgi:hypothetical protein
MVDMITHWFLMANNNVCCTAVWLMDHTLSLSNMFLEPRVLRVTAVTK